MFSYFSPFACHLRGLIKSLDSSPPDAKQLTQLRHELITRHADLPTSVLWKIHDKAKAAAVKSPTNPLAALLQDIHYGAERELANRNRAT